MNIKILFISATFLTSVLHAADQTVKQASAKDSTELAPVGVFFTIDPSRDPIYKHSFPATTTVRNVITAINNTEDIMARAMLLELNNLRVIDGITTTADYDLMRKSKQSILLGQKNKFLLTPLEENTPLWQLPKFLPNEKYGNQIYLTLSEDAQKKLHRPEHLSKEIAAIEAEKERLSAPNSIIMFHRTADGNKERVGTFLNTESTKTVADRIFKLNCWQEKLTFADLRVLGEEPTTLTPLNELVGQLPCLAADGNVHITLSPQAAKKLAATPSLGTTPTSSSAAAAASTTAPSSSSSSSSSSASIQNNSGAKTKK